MNTYEIVRESRNDRGEPMTDTKRQAIARFGQAGSLYVDGIWIWRADVRESDRLAKLVIDNCMLVTR